MNIPHYIGFDVHKKHINFCRRVARPLISWEGATKWVPHPRDFCEGGRDAACSTGFDFPKIQWYKQHRTHPCKERKDGAPTVPEWEGETTRVGHPPVYINFDGQEALY